ncbi:MAG: sigma factor [Planctomycetota bacterium]
MDGDQRTEQLSRKLAAVRRRLHGMGARSSRRALDLEDLVQETAASVLEHGRDDSLALWMTVAANKARDTLRGRGRSPVEELGERRVDELARARPSLPGVYERWASLCLRARALKSDARRVLAMRQGLEADWGTIAFLEQRQAEAARSLYYRSRDVVRSVDGEG